MDALLVVDVQNDFMPYGCLPVAGGDEVVPVVNALMPRYELVVATQDWHPAGHGSFASSHADAHPGDIVRLGGVDQVLWPDHCVQNAPGASFHSGLDIARVGHVVRKGTDPGIDSYSAFFDNHHLKETGLAAWLSEHGVKRVVVLGLATDYCVLFTALDAAGLGLSVVVVEDGCRAVDLAPSDGDRALLEMEEAGCSVVTSRELLEG